MKYMPIIVPQDAIIYSLFISVNRSTCFGWYLHPSSGAHVSVGPCTVEYMSIIVPQDATVYSLKNERPTWCHLLFYFTSYVLNMFRTLIYPSSGACDCCWITTSVFLFCKDGWFSVSLNLQNKTTDVVFQQHSRKLLKMDILMSETCWTHNKWNKIASDIKLVFHSSTITMIHGPINIIYTVYLYL